jgi:hypothetical protein
VKRRRGNGPVESNKIKRVPPSLRLSASPLSRLKSYMDIYQLTAADEILAAFKMSVGLPVQRDPDLDIPLPTRTDAADEHAAHRSDLVHTYPAWRRDLVDTVVLRVADAVLFHETALCDIDATNRWRKGTAREHLAVALKHFAALRGNCPRGAHWRFKR